MDSNSSAPTQTAPTVVGLGFRLGIAEALLSAPASNISFVEIAPENYLGVGGRRARLLEEASRRWPVVCHGLCGDLAGMAPLDRELLEDLRDFLDAVGARWYSDHLCLTHIGGAEIHELVPLPFTDEAVERTARRIEQVRDILDRPLAVENVSAYAHMPGGAMSEAEFVRAVVERADCHLLLDVNNVYVNANNFGFDARAYIDALPLERVLEIHMAGHDREDEDLLLDTHATPIVDPVYELFDYALDKLPHRPPVLLERDGNFPPIEELFAEVSRIERLMEDRDEAA